MFLSSLFRYSADLILDAVHDDHGLSKPWRHDEGESVGISEGEVNHANTKRGGFAALPWKYYDDSFARVPQEVGLVWFGFESQPFLSELYRVFRDFFRLFARGFILLCPCLSFGFLA